MFRGNKIYKIDKNGVKKEIFGFIPGLAISFRGRNSTITFGKLIPKFKHCKIILGNNCHVNFGDNENNIKNLIVSCHTNNGICQIGKNFNANSCAIYYAREDNISVSIGDDCLFANDISIRASDSHSIVDLENNILNKSKEVNIGNHVWCGYGVSVLKNIKIADNCVIGYKSIVTKDCDIPNSIYAGVPAKLVKKDVNWAESCPTMENIND